MKRLTRKAPLTEAVDVDSLLLDSYLLVVELRQGGSARSSDALWDLCAGQIESVRRQLQDAGMSLLDIDLISHAQCALLDETVLSWADSDARAKWTNEPLQARFFSRHQAGVFLYEEMSEVLRQPAPDPAVLTVYHRILMLGFLGRYRTLDDPQRQRIVTALNAHVFPLNINEHIPTVVGKRPRMNRLNGLRSPTLHALVALLVLGGTWWGLDHLLANLIASLAVDQV